MTKNFVKFLGFVLIALFICGCSSKKVEPLAVAPIPIKNTEKDVSLEEFDLIVKNQIKGSPSKAIWLEQFATEETKKEYERLNAENQKLSQVNKALNEQIERQTKEFENKFAKLSQDLEQKLVNLVRENEGLKKQIETLLQEKQQAEEVRNKLAEEVKKSSDQNPWRPSTFVSGDIEVPIRVESKKPIRFKIINKKTGKSFIYQMPEFMAPGGAMNMPGSPGYQKTIKLVPGEYKIETNNYDDDPFRKNVSSIVFTVSKEPIAEVNGEKIHALIQY
jgi:hypothetical protein